MTRRRVQEFQNAESKMLTEHHTVKNERDSLNFQLAKLNLELNNQKAAAQ